MVIKIKTVTIKIQSEDEFERKVRKHLAKIDSGVFKKPVRETSFTSLEALKRILTKKRLELMHCIKHKKAKSIYDLAKFLKRDVKNVGKDVWLLEHLGFIEVRKDKADNSERRTCAPRIHFDRINVAISI